MNRISVLAVILILTALGSTPLVAQTTPTFPLTTYLPITIRADLPVAQATATEAPVTATPSLPPTEVPSTQTPTATPIPATATPTASCSCDGNTMNCSDFGTQADAQACHDHCIAETGRDIHRLDQDDDGIACESLPVWILSVVG